jgi:hypothetical protein
MAQSTGVIVAVGAISFANQVAFRPIASGGAISPNLSAAWRIPVGTAAAAMALAGLEKLSPKLAVGLAYISLITVLFARIGGTPAPLENVAKVLGYK